MFVGILHEHISAFSQLHLGDKVSRDGWGNVRYTVYVRKKKLGKAKGTSVNLLEAIGVQQPIGNKHISSNLPPKDEAESKQQHVGSTKTCEIRKATRVRWSHYGC